LPPKPLAVLAYLVAHAGQVATKEALLEAVWPDTVVTEGVLKTCLGQIRQALGERANAPRYIATVHRRGYRFIGPLGTLSRQSMAPTETMHQLRVKEEGKSVRKLRHHKTINYRNF
jgi:DNA-binding winged helix-turn-helix (wHTH) protein